MRLGTVTSTAPLMVRLDGAGLDVPAVPTTAATAVVGGRVLVETVNRQVYVIAAVTG